MTFRMLDNQGEIEGYASAVAQVAGIPQQHACAPKLPLLLE